MVFPESQRPLLVEGRLKWHTLGYFSLWIACLEIRGTLVCLGRPGIPALGDRSSGALCVGWGAVTANFSPESREPPPSWTSGTPF